MGSDGPEMIVEDYDKNGGVICSFWEGVSRKQQTFREEDLEKSTFRDPNSGTS
jgi:uncharacterized protein YodC (DUF2158 family)